MSTPTDLEIVRRSSLNLLWQHCSECRNLDDQQRAFLQEHHVETPYAPPPHEPASKRRKTLPNPPATGSTELLNSRKGVRKKMHKARDWFLKNAPKASQWYNRQIDIVGEAKNYEAIIQSLTEPRNVSILEVPNQGYPASENDLVAIGMKLAVLADSSFKNEALQKPFSYFQALLFLSYCALLEKQGVPYEKVDQITQHASCFREMDRRRLRSQSLKVNRLIRKLVEGGWTVYRATELFFINPLSPTYLLSIDEEGFQLVSETLIKDEYVKHDFTDCLRPEYTIPGLISHMVYGVNAAIALSINEICVGLGYNPAAVPKSVDHIHSTSRLS